MINRVVLVGRLTRDPELRYTPSGVPVSSFTLAVNRTFTNQQGEREADFINCVVWRKTAENVANYLRKGSLVGVEGRIQTRSYENQEGRKVYVTEVVADSVQFLEPKGSGYQSPQNPSNIFDDIPSPTMPSQPTAAHRSEKDDNPFASDSSMIDISDDDLPF